MKKLLLMLALVLVASQAEAAPVGHNQGLRSNVLSSGALSADGAVKATGGVVYGVTGYVVAGAPGIAFLVDGDISDSETAAKQMISLGNVASGPIDVSIPNGVRFSDGIYLNEKSGAVILTVLYQ